MKIMDFLNKKAISVNIKAADKEGVIRELVDLLAGATEVMEDRSRSYQSALDQVTLNPQIRSEMAVRLAQIADERGAVDQEKKYFSTAVGRSPWATSRLTVRSTATAGMVAPLRVS